MTHGAFDTFQDNLIFKMRLLWHFFQCCFSEGPVPVVTQTPIQHAPKSASDAFYVERHNEGALRASIGDENSCWICLEGPHKDAPLLSPCRCTHRQVHAICIAKWQRAKRNTYEETHCRFCQAELQDWHDTLKTHSTPHPTITHQVTSSLNIPIIWGTSLVTHLVCDVDADMRPNYPESIIHKLHTTLCSIFGENTRLDYTIIPRFVTRDPISLDPIMISGTQSLTCNTRLQHIQYIDIVVDQSLLRRRQRQLHSAQI